MGLRQVLLGMVHVQTGPDSGELETGSAVSFLGQKLMALGSDTGSWAVGRGGGTLEEVGLGQSGPLLSSGP